MSQSAVSKRKPKLCLEPQRNDGAGWRACPEHRAQAWAVLLHGKCLHRAQTKKRAAELLSFAEKRLLGPRPSYRLGSRMGPRK